jgi:hypothetical protein
MENTKRKLSAVVDTNTMRTFKTPNGAYSLDTSQDHVRLLEGKAYIAVDAVFDNPSMPSHVLRDIGINSYIRMDDFGVDDFNAQGELQKPAYIN